MLCIYHNINRYNNIIVRKMRKVIDKIFTGTYNEVEFRNILHTTF